MPRSRMASRVSYSSIRVETESGAPEINANIEQGKHQADRRIAEPVNDQDRVSLSCLDTQRQTASRQADGERIAGDLVDQPGRSVEDGPPPRSTFYARRAKRREVPARTGT